MNFGSLSARVAIVGLDGLSWNYLSKMFEGGVMPYTKSLIQHCYKFTLEAFPPTTLPSWTSIMTGVNPGKHGILAFDYIEEKTLEQRLFSALHLEHPRIHEMLAMLGIPSVVINPIPGYPLIPVKSCKILCQTVLIPWTQYFPEDMRRFAERLTPLFRRVLNADRIRGARCWLSVERYVDLIEEYVEVVEELATTTKWQLYWICLQVPDLILHRCGFEVLDKLLPEEKRIMSIADRIIRTLDELSDALVIVSDHGFSRYSTIIRINDILVRSHYARIYREGEGKALKESWDLRRGPRRVSASRIRIPMCILRVLMHPSLRSIRRSLRKVYTRLTGKVPLVEYQVDLASSEAFFPSHWSLGVYVRNPLLVDDIIRILKGVEGIKWVLPREKVYWGPYVCRAPHVVFCPDYDRGYLQADNKVLGVTHMRGIYKDHHPQGVLAVKAPELELRDEIKVPNYVVSPLVMLMLGVPLPSSTDAIGILTKIAPEVIKKAKFIDYIPRWKLMKRVALFRTTGRFRMHVRKS